MTFPNLPIKLPPQDMFQWLLKNHYFPVLMESSYYHSDYGRYTVMAADPVAEIKLYQQCISVKEDGITAIHQGDVLHLLSRLLQKYRPSCSQNAAYFTGGAVGFFSYDFCQSLWPHHTVGKSPDWPECFFRIYPWALVYDHKENSYSFHGASAQVKNTLLTYSQKSEDTTLDLSIKIEALRSMVSKKEYLAQIRTIHEWLREGDVYQVNLSQQFKSHLFQPEKYTHTDTAWQLYRRLTTVNPAPFSVFLPVDSDKTVLSASPELFFRLRDRKVCMRPIKGTAPRKDISILDEREKEKLWNSEKDQAELVMIVDLERNDLGRVCEYGTITVPELRKLETYATVHHLVATIEGQLRKDMDVFDLVRSTFPCGSITGAPKLRAMERINQLEKVSREVYTGSIGWIDFTGNADFNVAIRTLLAHQDELTFNVGGGIVIDSLPEKEYEETLYKGEGLVRALGHTLRAY